MQGEHDNGYWSDDEESDGKPLLDENYPSVKEGENLLDKHRRNLDTDSFFIKSEGLDHASASLSSCPHLLAKKL